MEAKERFLRVRLFLAERFKRPLSGKELAEILGITQPVLSNIETGKRKPTSNVALRFQRHFAIDPNWLLTGAGPAPWEQNNQPVFYDFSLVRENREAGKYNQGPDKTLRGITALQKIGERMGGERLIDYVVEAGDNPDFMFRLIHLLDIAAEQLNYRIEDLKQQIADLKRKLDVGQSQYDEQRKELIHYKRQFGELAPPMVELVSAPAPVERPALEPAAAPAGNTYWIAGAEQPEIRQAAEPSLLFRDYPELAARLEALAANPQKMFLLSKLLEELEKPEKKEEKP